jgi:hypothetical protein
VEGVDWIHLSQDRDHGNETWCPIKGEDLFAS